MWGRGHATEGSRALIEKAFTDLGARRVRVETVVVHTTSRRVMEAGLKYARTFHADWPYKIEGDEEGRRRGPDATVHVASNVPWQCTT